MQTLLKLSDAKSAILSAPKEEAELDYENELLPAVEKVARARRLLYIAFDISCFAHLVISLLLEKEREHARCRKFLGDIIMIQARSNLRFREEAQSALAFLVKDCGFSSKTASDREIRYESKTVWLEMNHGLHDCEVFIQFGRLGTEEDYSFNFFLKLVNPVLEKSLGEMMADTPEEVASTVRALDGALRSQGQGIIQGDHEAFERMKGVFWWHFQPEALRRSEKA